VIPRYEKTEISSLWSENAKFETYLDVEIAIMKALEGDKVPAGLSQKIRGKVSINPARIAQIEAITRHDIIAFCTSITENLTAEEGRFFHFGVTSSDIIDSALTLQIKRSLERILPVYEGLLHALANKANEQKEIITMGRSHGMMAEPLSMGQKLLGHYNEFSRRYIELRNFMHNELTVQFSGAVGNYTILTPQQELTASKELGLKVEPLSTQVIPRDRIAKLISLNALTASAIERLAVEIRHLHRTEVNELHEGFSKGQKGSSTMPHKKNPISGENLTGMARFLRSHLSVALENIVLWHERDISHSSTERLYLPDHFGILYYSLERLTKTVEQLEFHNDVIEKRVRDNFGYLSSFYLHQLIEKTSTTREELYAIVQQAAFEGQEKKDPKVFIEVLEKGLKNKELEVPKLPLPTFEEVKKIYLKHVDEIFERSFKTYPTPNL
jgi:adenylosuccinate lyase